MKPSVLIVDDSLTVRMDLKAAFEADGYACGLAATLGEARSALARQHFDLIILDVLLPDGNGVEMLAELTNDPDPDIRATPVIMLSTEADIKSRLRALQVGADDYVGKPYEKDYLLCRANELLRGTEKGTAADAPPKLLVIDDSKTYREWLRQIVEPMGYNVLEAEGGEQGLRMAARAHPVAIVVDGIMPGVDGLTVVHRLRTDTVLRGVPCLFVTGSEDRTLELRALESGADAFVRKEDDPTTFLAKLGSLVRDRRRSRAESGVTGLFGAKKLLLVGTDAAYFAALSAQLREEQWEITIGQTIAEAQKLLQIDRVDCLIVEAALIEAASFPEIAETAESLGVPLMVLGYYTSNAIFRSILKAGADDLLLKSNDFSLIKAQLRNRLARRQIEEERFQRLEQALRREAAIGEARALKELADTRATLITELKRKNDELFVARESALETARLKSGFLANMSHEIRTPLNSIIGFSEILHDGIAGSVSDRQKEFLGDVLTSAHHLLQLINDVLDLSKIEAGKMEFHPEPIDLAKLIGEVEEIMRTLLARKHLSLEVKVDPDLKGINLDPGKLKQVLFNYLSNAIKFTPDNGQIAIVLRPQGAADFVLEVRDTGIGIRAEDIARLFVEFQQLDVDVSKKYPGSGLGLALTKRIVEAQHGEVGVTSTPGKGSVFFARLPRIFPAAEAAATRVPAPNPNQIQEPAP